MRILEVLLEYNRDVTKRNFGNLIIKRARTDDAFNLIPDDELVNTVLQQIENKDPTPNKEYTPWLTRMYAKTNLKIEDINRNDYLRAYHIGKQRNVIRSNLHRDINNFDSYSSLEDTLDGFYDADEILDDADKNKIIPKGESTTVYEDEIVRIIVPGDEQAACYYGRGTRWCTASTRGENYFDRYNSRGSLYILLPKHPDYTGEKYQLHFESKSFMNERDEPVNIRTLLIDRFPNIFGFFRKKYPNLILR